MACDLHRVDAPSDFRPACFSAVPITPAVSLVQPCRRTASCLFRQSSAFPAYLLGRRIGVVEHARSGSPSRPVRPRAATRYPGIRRPCGPRTDPSPGRRGRYGSSEPGIGCAGSSTTSSSDRAASVHAGRAARDPGLTALRLSLGYRISPPAVSAARPLLSRLAFFVPPWDPGPASASRGFGAPDRGGGSRFSMPSSLPRLPASPPGDIRTPSSDRRPRSSAPPPASTRRRQLHLAAARSSVMRKGLLLLGFSRLVPWYVCLGRVLRDAADRPEAPRSSRSSLAADVSALVPPWRVIRRSGLAPRFGLAPRASARPCVAATAAP